VSIIELLLTAMSRGGIRGGFWRRGLDLNPRKLLCRFFRADGVLLRLVERAVSHPMVRCRLLLHQVVVNIDPDHAGNEYYYTSS